MGLKEQREIVKSMIAHDISERRACELIGFNRSSIRYQQKEASPLKERVVNKVLAGGGFEPPSSGL